MQAPINGLVAELIVRGLDDFIQAAEVASVIISAGQTEPAQVRAAALKEIGTALESELMVIGTLGQEGFAMWMGSLDMSMGRLAEAWPIDRTPELGEVCWLANTPHGDARAEEILIARA